MGSQWKQAVKDWQYWSTTTSPLYSIFDFTYSDNSTIITPYEITYTYGGNGGATPPEPKIETDMDWLHKQVTEICEYAYA